MIQQDSRRAACIQALCIWTVVTALALNLAGCGDTAATPTAAAPSPTIAAPPPRPSATPGAAGAAATRAPVNPLPTATPPTFASPTAAPQAGTPTKQEPFVYLWPTYLPEGMQLSPRESRVPREGEVGQNDLGFYIVTFAEGRGRMVVGGGATEPLPLTGDERRVEIGGRAATLTTNDQQHQVTFDVPKGTLFVYSSSLSEDELLRVAGSLQPIDLTELRARVGAE